MTSALATPVRFPSAKEDPWRYTPVDEIVRRYQAAAPASGGATAVAGPAPEVAALGGLPQLVLVNGLVDDDASDLVGLPVAVRCGRLDVAHDRRIVAATALTGDRPDDGFLVRNRAACRDAAIVVVDPDASVDVPVHVAHVTAPDPATSGPIATHPRTVIDVGDRSRVVVIETYGGDVDGGVTNAATVLRVGAGAVVDYCRLQAEAAGAAHVGHLSVRQDEGSVVRLTSLMLGGEVARFAADVALDGPDARVEFAGLSTAGSRQRHDTVVSVDHATSHGASAQRHAAVVADHGRSSFGGEIIVRPGTVGTDAHQMTRSLLLGPDAQADARPWLRILADDVRCTHGATVGRLDAEALFYLRSRGVPEQTARRMLIDAFVVEITGALPVPALREHVGAIVGRWGSSR